MNYLECPECGTSESDEAGKCARCGGSMVETSPDLPSPAPVPGPASPVQPTPYNIFRDWKFYILASFVAFGILLWAYGSVVDFMKPKRSDSDLFKDYYATILVKCALVDDAYRPFGKSLDENDVLATISAAKSVEGDVRQLWTDMNGVNVPDLANKEALLLLKDGHERITYAYMKKLQIIEGYIKFAESPSLSVAADVKDAGERVTPLIVGGLAKFFEAGTKLGLKPEDIAKIGN